MEFIGSPESWIILVILFGAIEGLTMGLTSLWLAAGSIIAFVAAVIGMPAWLQIGLFAVSTAIFMIYARPIVKNHMKKGLEMMKIYSLIGMDGIVSSSAGDLKPGQVNVNGQVWNAESDDEAELKEDAAVQVVRIEGGKLIVKQK
jgi:membrane protein implicated in regulation of membrane protease activity